MKKSTQLLVLFTVFVALAGAILMFASTVNAVEPGQSCTGPQCWRIIQFPAEWRSQLTWATIIGAAIIDAINPCEFAILILLMATFLVDGQRKKALKSGLAFAGAIFLMYFAMGLGLFQIIQGITYASLIKKIVAIVAIILGALNIKDYVSYGGGGFVMEVPKKWRPRMKDIVKRVTGPWGAFLAGIIVSIFLLPCTSGPYFVILGLLASAKVTYAKLLIYLLAYNLVFVMPMVAIVIAMYFGFGYKKAEEIRQKNLNRLHLIAGVIMVIIGILILANVI